MVPASKATERISPLEKKPLNGTMPASARQPRSMVSDVMGMCLRSPPMNRMSFVSTAWITLPALRNRSALKKA